jgi:hypothetical protein
MAAVKRNVRAVRRAESARPGPALGWVTSKQAARFEQYRADVIAAAGVGLDVPGVEFVPLALMWSHGVTVEAAAAEVIGMALAWPAIEAAGI